MSLPTEFCATELKERWGSPVIELFAISVLEYLVELWSIGSGAPVLLLCFVAFYWEISLI